jgi:hypothetical protein
LAWQSYGDAARQIIANSYPQLAWLAPQTAIEQIAPAMIVPPTTSPDPQEIKTISFDLAEVSQKIDQLAAAQERMAREIIKLQAVEEYVLNKNPEPPPQPAPPPTASPARNPTPKPLLAPTGR